MTDKHNAEPAKKETLGADALERELTTDLDDKTPDQPKGMPLHTRILIGLAVGVAAGVAVNIALGGAHPAVVWIVSNISEPVGELFLRLLLLIVVPLVFSSGAGAEMRHAIGIAVFSGMIGVTFFGLFLTPLFYVLLRAAVKSRRQHVPVIENAEGASHA